jgi:hypothetical protein
MADPASFVTAKIASAIGGFFGGASLMSFIRPQTIGEAFARGGISTGAAIIFAGPSLDLIGARVDWEWQLMAGGVVGFVAYSVMGAVANFMVKHREADIVELVNRTRQSGSSRGSRK